MKYRLAVIASHVIQYQDPLFKLLASHPEIDLTVLFCSRHGAKRYYDYDMRTELQWNLEMLQGYRHRFLSNWSPLGIHRRQLNLINPGVIPAVIQGRFDAVIVMFGWGSVTSWLTFLACKLTKTSFELYGDSSFVPAEKTFLGRVRTRVLRFLFAHTDAFLVSGAMNADYYRHYRANPARFFSVPWAVDNERFARVSHLSSEEKRRVRQQHGIDPDRVVLVFSGKLIERKDPKIILEAVERMQYRGEVAVVYLGEGELRPNLEAFARDRQIDQVVFTGFTNQAEIPRIYGMSDIFVLPSKIEPRGAVVNEAMACGLPVVTSSMVGSNGDIVRHGENGFIFTVGKADELASALDRLVGDDGLRARMSQRSREIIARWDYGADLDGILQALRSVTRNQNRQAA